MQEMMAKMDGKKAETKTNQENMRAEMKVKQSVAKEPSGEDGRLYMRCTN
jgi:hypothetical protein